MSSITLQTLEDEIRQQENLIAESTARLEKLRAARSILSDLASDSWQPPRSTSGRQAGREYEGRLTLSNRVEGLLRQRGPLSRRAIVDHITSTSPDKRRADQVERVLSVSLTRMKARGLVENESGVWRLKA